MSTSICRIVAVARRQKELLELAQEVQGPPGGAVLTPVVADISTPEGVDSVCSTVYQILLGLGQASHVAHVVHCAGVLESVGSKVLDVRAPTLRYDCVRDQCCYLVPDECEICD